MSKVRLSKSFSGRPATDNFYRFAEGKDQGEEALQQVLYAYESTDPSKSSQKPGQTVGPAVYQRTYTLFPKPAYRKRKCCGFGPKSILCVLLAFFFIVLLAILISIFAGRGPSSHRDEPGGSQPTNITTSPVLFPDAGAANETEPTITTSTDHSPRSRRRSSHTVLPSVVSTVPPTPTSPLAEAAEMWHPTATFRRITFPSTFWPQFSESLPTTFPNLDDKNAESSELAAVASSVLYTSTVDTTTRTAVWTSQYAPSPLCVLHCHRNGHCVNGTCRCKIGYEGDGIRVCANINECKRSKGICGCNAKCDDTQGSYRCTCKSGYERQVNATKCSDIDECRSHISVCPQFSRCINVSGGYRCICRENFVNSLDGATSCGKRSRL